MLLQRHILKLVVGKSVGSRKNFTIQYKVQLLKMSTTAPAKKPDMGNAPASNKTIIAVGQMRSTNDKADNMCQIEKLVQQAKSKSATFLFLPECCDFIGEHRQQTSELSEPLTGPTMQQYQELAKQNKIWLSLGGLHEAIPNEKKIHNTHVIINEQGQVVSIYRKLHLFDVDTPDFRFKESDLVMAGRSLQPPISTPIGNIGQLICYDLRFAEASLLLRKSGAQILTYPSAFTYATGKAHWEILLRARAIETQCFVIAAAQVGNHNPKRRSWGHAMIVNPWGKILVDCGGENDLTIGTAEIDKSDIDNFIKSIPCFEHRRDDVYCLTAFSFGTWEPKQDQLFAKNIISKETIFYETEHCFVFTNLRCVVEGHVLVSTKRIVPRLNGLICNEISDLFTTVCKIQRMLEIIYKTTSATVTVQDGTEAGQTVPHVHFHIMPRRPGDFSHNDQIYVKLDDRCLDQPDRDIKERIAEAEMYRNFLKCHN